MSLTKQNSNIKLLYIYNSLFFAMFFLPIITIFYVDSGLTFTEIAIVGIVAAIAAMLFEIPSGILADRWGRKNVLILAPIFLLTSLLLLIFGTNLIAYLASGAFFGFMSAAYSGSASSLLYDSLKQIRSEKLFEKTNGKIFMVASISGFISTFTAGYLYETSNTLPFIFSLAVAILMIFTGIALNEIKVKKLTNNNSKDHFISSLKEVLTKTKLRFILLYAATIMFAYKYLFAFGQVYLKDIGITVTIIGILYAIRLLIEGLGGLSSNKLQKLIGQKNSFTIIIIYTILILVLLSFVKSIILGAIIFSIGFILTGLHRITSQGYIHKHINSHNRATIESIIMFVVGLMSIILVPVLGKIADLFSLELTFVIIAALLGIYFIHYLFTMNKNKFIAN